MSKMQGIGRRALVGLAGAAFAARPAWAQAPAQDIRLGAIFPLSGPSGLLGDECFRGVELAVEERNAAGGIGGRPIRLLRADAPDELAAQTEARRLSQGNDRVAAFLGSFATPIALPASQVAELAGIPYFELGALADAVMERGFRWIFRLSPRAADFAATAIDAVTGIVAPSLGVAPEALKLAILHEDAAGGQSIGAAQEALIRVRSLTLVERITYAPRASDLSAVVQRLRGQDTQVVLHIGAPGDEVSLFRTLRDAAWRPRMVIGAAGGYGLTESARSIGDDLLGTMSADWTPFEVNERVAPGARAFPDLYLRRYGAEPRSGHGLAAFAGARVALEALARAGSTDRDRIRAAVQATDLAEGTTPASWGVRFDDRGQNLRAAPVLCQWQQAPGGGLRQVAIGPAAAAVADAIPRLGG
ncbi:ABC transporter substrate-binding protein [Roseomonas stagni]|uniref:ABC transporter substrate-binding protein n=1 Tax=Falsiroseomonas algicola TaxID=2716930 RepID=A0A6M1LGD4_9PROT|nr:ABC transporter substrate-binding protein [Falsiroseomonas algicola]NGM19353.1 ABC transporter substrate-binding protein [Falsiroseomonas algicola]